MALRDVALGSRFGRSAGRVGDRFDSIGEEVVRFALHAGTAEDRRGHETAGEGGVCRHCFAVRFSSKQAKKRRREARRGDGASEPAASEPTSEESACQ